MKAKGVIYGDSVSYREMCRYQSGELCSSSEAAPRSS